MTDITKQTRKELQARRDALAEEVDSRSKELAARARELDGLLSELGALGLVLGEDDFSGATRVRIQQVRQGALAQAPGSGHTGFRNRVRMILRENPQGMKPAEVRDELERSGFVLAGRTKLAVRVQNELYSLLSNGELEKTKDRKYCLLGS